MGLTSLLIAIVQLAMSILSDSQIGGKPVDIADKLLKIIGAAKQAFEQETGKAIDVGKIPKFEEIP